MQRHVFGTRKFNAVRNLVASHVSGVIYIAIHYFASSSLRYPFYLSPNDYTYLHDVLPCRSERKLFTYHTVQKGNASLLLKLDFVDISD